MSTRTLALGSIVALVAGCGVTGVLGALFWRFAESRAGLSAPRYAYWNDACFTADEKLMAAGGAGFAVLDLASGKVVGRGDEDVYHVTCPGPQAVVLGYRSTWTWPGGSRGPEAERRGDAVVAAFEDGTRVWSSRRTSRGRAAGPLTVTVERGTATHAIELGPQNFGEVGRAKDAPFPDNFGMWSGGALPDRRLLLAAGWAPNRVGAAVENVPWGFFALNLDEGHVEALLPPTPGDVALHMLRRPVLRASADGSTLVLATTNGTDAVVAIHDRSTGASRRARLGAWDEVSRLAVARDGSRVAVASGFHGKGSPAQIVLLDARDGRRLWGTEVEASVYGLALLRDGSLVWASSAREAARVALREGGLAWRLRMDAPSR